MSKKFSYSILTYRHSLFLGEVINIGILFVFPDEHLVEFHYPKRLNRIHGLYTNFNETLIKDYLKSFEKKSRNLHQQLDQYLFGFNDILSDHFIVEDASALQFSGFRSAVYHKTEVEVCEQYYNLILGDYNAEVIKTKHSLLDQDLVKKVKTKVYELNPAAKDYIKFDSLRILRSNHIQFKSDFYWKNGVVNYAKIISFDLATEEGIINKSLLLNGQLRQLEKSNHKNSHIDLVIHQPENNLFNSVVEEAIKIVQENQLEKRIFTHWSDYSSEIANNITTSDD